MQSEQATQAKRSSAEAQRRAEELARRNSALHAEIKLLRAALERHEPPGAPEPSFGQLTFLDESGTLAPGVLVLVPVHSNSGMARTVTLAYELYELLERFAACWHAGQQLAATIAAKERFEDACRRQGLSAKLSKRLLSAARKGLLARPER